MSAILTSAPALEPVSLAEAKAHLRLDTDTDDALVATLIIAARQHVERATKRVLISQDWNLFHDAFPPCGILELAIAPVLAVNAVTVHDGAGGTTVIDPAAYQVDTVSAPARVALLNAGARLHPGRPLNGIEIAVTAGYGAAAADVPAPLRQAILMLLAHWYEQREAASAVGAPVSVPFGVAALVAPYQRVLL